MKNIHLVPTDKPSRLFKVSGELKLTRNFDFYNGSEYQNIYITSDEEIKEDDWVVKISSLYKGGGNVQKYSFIDTQFEDITFKKIILTTDQDLIKDGVQVIDDTFLQWFVKNPSCEHVSVQKRYSDFTVEPFVGYKIIIPQEEPKQECEHIKEYGCIKDICTCNTGPKQETLEEAAKKRYIEGVYVINGIDICDASKECFIEGAKWQAERMYSEEEVEKMVRAAYTFGEKEFKYFGAFKEWFEQFKKK
jgi:hypothetical protein